MIPDLPCLLFGPLQVEAHPGRDSLGTVDGQHGHAS